MQREPRASIAERADNRRAAAGQLDDAGLIAAVCARDLHAFEELYRSFHPRLTRFIGNLIHRPHTIEEVLNDTMFVVWDRPESFNGASKLSTWIFAIAYRKALKALRRTDDPVEDRQADARPSPEPGPDFAAGLRNVQEALGGAMAALSADHRVVVDLTYFHEMSYREIAEIMDCPVDTVKTRMFHARRRLKAMLAGNYSDWL